MTVKYREGDTFEDVDALTSWLIGGGWVYWQGVVKHPSIIRHMTFETVINAQPYMRRAIQTTKETND